MPDAEMNHKEIKTLDEEFEKIECQIDYLEDHYDAEHEDSERHNQWKELMKKSVILKMHSYQLVFPDAELQLHKSGMQFRVINRREPASYGYSNDE